MNFDQAYNSSLRNSAPGEPPAPPVPGLSNPALVEKAWEDYNDAIEATKLAKDKLAKYTADWQQTEKDLVNYYRAQLMISAGFNNPSSVADSEPYFLNQAKAYMRLAIDQLVKNVNAAVVYEEAKRQAYISISAANGIQTYETTQTEQLNAETVLAGITSISRNKLLALGAVIIIILILIFK